VIFNEFAQWAVLVVMAILMLGLVRQLGHFIVPRRDHLLYLGPDIGKTVPEALIDGVPVGDLRKQINESADGLGLIAVINDRCAGCKGMLAQLQAIGKPRDCPLVAVAHSEDDEYIGYVRGLFDYVAWDVDGSRAHDAGIIATPFVLAIDSELTVEHRGISGGLHELLAEWTGRSPTRPGSLTPEPQEGNSPVTAEAEMA